MAVNIEMKARVADLAAVRERARAVATGRCETLSQIDTFFDAPGGRLKVREFADGSGELITYQRSDAAEPKTSSYHRVPCADAAALASALAFVLPPRGRVVKRRDVIMAGRTRIHLDEVVALGSFVELEVVLGEGEPPAAGHREARELMAALGVEPSMLVAGGYIDLLDRARQMYSAGGRAGEPHPA
jgi:adenylate cyclase class IV